MVFVPLVVASLTSTLKYIALLVKTHIVRQNFGWKHTLDKKCVLATNALLIQDDCDTFLAKMFKNGHLETNVYLSDLCRSSNMRHPVKKPASIRRLRAGRRTFDDLIIWPLRNQFVSANTSDLKSNSYTKLRTPFPKTWFNRPLPKKKNKAQNDPGSIFSNLRRAEIATWSTSWKCYPR